MQAINLVTRNRYREFSGIRIPPEDSGWLPIYHHDFFAANGYYRINLLAAFYARYAQMGQIEASWEGK